MSNTLILAYASSSLFSEEFIAIIVFFISLSIVDLFDTLSYDYLCFDEYDYITLNEILSIIKSIATVGKRI